ncbi:MAG: NUDIX domain-containing protein [Gemmatimonadota bacterium]
MSALAADTNPFGGVIPDPGGLDGDPERFRVQLRRSLAEWRAAHRLVWLEIPRTKAALVPVAVAEGFGFHHCGDEYLMLVLRLEEGAFIPRYASHYIGAGGVVLNERQELLVVSERYHRPGQGPPRYKLPGGALHEGEHLADGVVREVLEETGVRTRFESLICFRHWHGYRYGKSDIYFICRLCPESREISIQEEEIAEARWMPVADYLADENVSSFNKEVVRAAMDHRGLEPVRIEGYGDPERYEFFLPGGGGLRPRPPRRDDTPRPARDDHRDQRDIPEE